MKFGKALQKIVALSDSEWAPFWISYKALKKRVKDLKAKERAESAAAAQASPSDLEDAAAAEATGGKCGGGGACCVDRPPTAQDLACSAGEVSWIWWGLGLGDGPLDFAGFCSLHTHKHQHNTHMHTAQVAFFKTIRSEIAKATDFFIGMEQQMDARKRRIRCVGWLVVVALVVSGWAVPWKGISRSVG